jgi:hypothetical protein
MFANDKEYYGDRKYLTTSSLKMLRKSVKKFNIWMAGLISEEPSDALQQGSALHALVLENKKIFVGYEGRRAGAEYKKFLDDKNDEMFVFTMKDEKLIHDMYRALYECNESFELLFDPSNESANEIPMTAELFGIAMKGKADRVLYNATLPISNVTVGSFGVDLKTTGGDLDEFARSARFYDYDMQAYVYSQIFGLDGFVFVVVSKKWPYEVGIFECSDEFIASGEAKAKQAINKYIENFVESKYNPNKASYVTRL